MNEFILIHYKYRFIAFLDHNGDHMHIKGYYQKISIFVNKRFYHE